MIKVLDQYVQAMIRIYSKALRNQNGALTEAQKKGIAYYTAAAERVRALIDAPTPEWVGLKFEKKLY